MEDKEGSELHKEHLIAQAILRYYQTLFSTNSCEKLEIVEELIQPIISDQMNVSFIATSTDQGIHEVLLEINTDKTPGLDGLSVGFYYSY